MPRPSTEFFPNAPWRERSSDARPRIYDDLRKLNYEQPQYIARASIILDPEFLESSSRNSIHALTLHSVAPQRCGGNGLDSGLIMILLKR
jgi:hypothetical protein